jgi:hypothetical protein
MGIIDKVLGFMMKKNLDKVEKIMEVGSPELKRQAEKADKARQEFRKAADRAYKSLTGKKQLTTKEKRKAGKLV